MLALQAQGWGAKRISQELGCSRNTVREYLRIGGWKPMDVSGRASILAPHLTWLEQRLRQHKGNADVVSQELQREFGIAVSLLNVQRAEAPMRAALRVALRGQAVAHVRFEAAPWLQLQVDFGSTHVQVGEELVRVFMFVATLGYSRRTYVLLSLHERQSAWLLGLGGAFRHFGGVTQEVLIDNAKTLVEEHNRQTREVMLNDRFRSFCSYWGVTHRACALYRAQTKGKDERGVGYVKRNAIAGHTFASLDALQARLDRWVREVADVRVHGTTGEPPIERFERDGRCALCPLPNKAPFLQVRELVRRVHTDACIELDTNRYTVPWKLIGEQVRVVVADRQVQVLYAGQEVARHAQSSCAAAASSSAAIWPASWAASSSARPAWYHRLLRPPPSCSVTLSSTRRWLGEADDGTRQEDRASHAGGRA